MESIFGLHDLKTFWDQQDLKCPRLASVKSWVTLGHRKNKVLTPAQSFITQLLRKTFKNIKKELPLVFALHGDAAPHTEVDSLLVISMRSLTSGLPVSECQLLLFALPKSMLTKETLAPIWKTISWSLEAMTKGKWPAKAPPSLPTYKAKSSGKDLMGYEKRAMVTRPRIFS